mmetsp:Transcript_38100/g.104880  ORF Transcript_38100/g.104880 Transcript_38100/m.104880 type:complete len:240 (-) Transcript_38100:244-963(-)
MVARPSRRGARGDGGRRELHFHRGEPRAGFPSRRKCEEGIFHHVTYHGLGVDGSFGAALPKGLAPGASELRTWLQLWRGLRACRWQPGGGHFQEDIPVFEPVAAPAFGRRTWRTGQRQVDRRIRRTTRPEGAFLPAHFLRGHLLAVCPRDTQVGVPGRPAGGPRRSVRLASRSCHHRGGSGLRAGSTFPARATHREGAHGSSHRSLAWARRRGARRLRLRLLQEPAEGRCQGFRQFASA